MRRDVFQAIADPTRRAIIGLISLGAMTPNAMAEQFAISRQGISKHLKILSECELVKQVQSGREIYYHLQPKKFKVVDEFIEPFRKLWDTRFKQVDELLGKIKNEQKKTKNQRKI